MGRKHSKQTTVVVDSSADTTPAAEGTTAAPTPNTNSNYETEMVAHVIGFAGKHLPLEERLDYAAASNRHRDALFGDAEDRQIKIIHNLLHAVAYGMESRDVNVNTQPKDLFAKDLLIRSPEFLLERGDIKDWGGRTFKNITAFEYALWAKDFKMLEMMLGRIPATAEGDRIRAGLLEQYEQVTAPIYAGGGLTYELTYDQPTMDANGIPIKDAAGVWQTTSVTEVHTENHFDVTPLRTAYQDYVTNFYSRTWPQLDACWVKKIGTLQRLLPIHFLQRYCDPDATHGPVTFAVVFKRTTQLSSPRPNRAESILSSSLSTDFSLVRVFWNIGGRKGGGGSVIPRAGLFDLAISGRVDEISTHDIETKIRPLLSIPAQCQTQFRP